MGKLIVLGISLVGVYYLIGRFPVLTAPAFHIGGLGVAWGFLAFAGVGLLVMRLKSGK